MTGGFGCSDAGVAAESCLPVAACLAVVADGCAGMGEAMVGAGLLDLITDVATQRESCDLLGRTVRLSLGEENLAETVECRRFAHGVADLAADVQGAMIQRSRVVVTVLEERELAEVGQRLHPIGDQTRL
jgi:hypothetical protein